MSWLCVVGCEKKDGSRSLRTAKKSEREKKEVRKRTDSKETERDEERLERQRIERVLIIMIIIITMIRSAFDQTAEITRTMKSNSTIRISSRLSSKRKG